MDVDDFELSSLGVKELIIAPENLDTDINGIERRILGVTDKHSLPNKGNDPQGSGKAVSPWWMLLDIQSTVNVVINKGLVREILDACGRFVRVNCNSGRVTIRTEDNLTGFGTIWFNNM